MSKRKYHQGLSQAYRHKALEHASLARAHARNNNAEGVAHHGEGFRQNMQQSMWHESEAELAHGPVDDVTGEAYENTARPSYDPYYEPEPRIGGTADGSLSFDIEFEPDDGGGRYGTHD